jgi:WD40 repeat protein
VLTRRNLMFGGLAAATAIAVPAALLLPRRAASGSISEYSPPKVVVTAEHTLTVDGMCVHLAFSPDGKTLACGGYASQGGKAVQLWDVDRGTPTATLPAGDYSSAMAYLPDGKTLAVCGHEDVNVWNVDSGDKVASFATHDDGGFLAVRPDGKILATSGGHGVRLWDTRTRDKIATLADTVANVMAFSPDGKHLAAVVPDDGGADSVVRVWEVDSGKQTVELPTGANSLEFFPDGKALAVGSFEVDTARGRTRLWDLATGKRVSTLAGKGPSMALSLDGTILVTGGEPGDPGAWCWDPNTGHRLNTLTSKETEEMTFSPKGDTIAAIDRESTIDNSDTSKVMLWTLKKGS